MPTPAEHLSSATYPAGLRPVAALRLAAMALITAAEVASTGCSESPAATATQPAITANVTSSEVQLGNGVTVITMPVESASRVALEVLYDVGFLHDPAGHAQAAHLIEHLVWQSATKSFGAGEAFARGNRLGMANAETLADMTHYDYVVPTESLEWVLRVEAERLTHLRFDGSVIQQEAQKCYREADAVEAYPASGMVKFAFMAFAQAWHHGARSVTIRSGLEQMPLDALQQFHRAGHRPNGMTVVLVGAFDPEKARQLLENHLGRIADGGAPRPQGPDYTGLPARIDVTWDSTVEAVCVAFPPPDDPADRLALTAWMEVNGPHLMQDKRLQDLASMVMASNRGWPVGTLPVFAYAAAREGTDLATLEKELIAAIDRHLLAKPGRTSASAFRQTVGQLARTPVLNDQMVRDQVQTMKGKTGSDEDALQGIVICNAALQWGIASRLKRNVPSSALNKLQNITNSQLNDLLHRCLTPERRFITILHAAKPDSPATTPAPDP